MNDLEPLDRSASRKGDACYCKDARRGGYNAGIYINIKKSNYYEK